MSFRKCTKGRRARKRLGAGRGVGQVSVLDRTPPDSAAPQPCRFALRTHGSTIAGIEGATGAPDIRNLPRDGPAPMLVDRGGPGPADPARRPALAPHGAASARHPSTGGSLRSRAATQMRPSDRQSSLGNSRRPRNSGRQAPWPLGTPSGDRMPKRPTAARDSAVRASDHAPSGSPPGRRR